MRLKLSIIDRYLIREILFTTLAVLLVLMLVVISLEIIHFLVWFQEGELTETTILPMFFNSLAGFVVLLIPLGLFLGVILAFSRLYMDSEMTAMMASGIGPRQWYRSLLLIVVPMTVIVLILMLYARPWVATKRAEINAEIRNTHAINALMPGHFNSDPSGNAVLFVESITDDSTRLSNVFQHYYRDGDRHVDISDSASKLFFEDRQYMLFSNGNHYVGNPGEADFTVIEYEQYGVLVPEWKSGFHPPRVKSLSTDFLLGSDMPEHRAEIDWRITIPAATLIISLIALPLSQTSPRGGRYARLGLAMFIYLVYSNFLGMGKTWIARETVPVWIGTTWVHLLALVLLIFLLKRSGMLTSLLQPSQYARKNTA